MTEAKCGWWDSPGPLDDGEPEVCTSGKPATHINCGLVGVPVCEDHRCRCSPIAKSPPGPSYTALGTAPEDPGIYEGGHGKPSGVPLADPSRPEKKGFA